MITHGKTGAISRKLVIWLSIPFILVGLFIGCSSATRHKHKRARADWMATTLPRLASLSLTNEDISRELDRLKARRGSADREQWTGDHVLLMTNDEYLVYASRHGFNNGFVDHLFLARGSDGRWYFSTYHFCNSMGMLMTDDPPGPLAEFAAKQAARKFGAFAAHMASKALADLSKPEFHFSQACASL